ncbi:pseudouridine synthase [Candidatus Omnitrophota bacterium]
MKIRINKFISQAGVASRRKADELILKGKVSVNGTVLTEPGVEVDAAVDKVSVNGKEIILDKKREFNYYLLNKPKGYISTTSDTHQRQTVMELVPKKQGLYPVGRLDKDTTGLILITDDGELANRLMHPSYKIDKEYKVGVRGIVEKSTLNKLKKGVDIGDKRLSKLDILDIKHDDKFTVVNLKIHEGRKRQIRRTFQELGHHVFDIDRISYASLKIDMRRGKCRRLTKSEIEGLKREVKLL